VDPATVEAALAACPGAGETAVCGLADPRWGQRLVALYTGNVPVGTLEAWAHDHLPSPQRPRRYVRVASLPRNAMGKLVRRDLPVLAAGG
jgi:O-succinylbenzoic acid--CoA ligase